MSALDPSRDRAVQAMFDRIAARYDLLNRVISFRLDSWWRNQAINVLLTAPDPLILDLGTGTGDLTFAAAKAVQGNGRFVGLDFSLRMLRLAQEKKSTVAREDKIFFVLGSALSAPFRDAAFDGIMTAFVLRNVSDLSLFFAHAFRLLKPGGKFVSLDMFPPPKGWFAALYSLYFYRWVPWIGGLLARDRDAYAYLSKSVRGFHPPETIASAIERAGFERVTVRRFLRGAVCLHVGEKAARCALDA
jgi:demethylmenaquinone methyltransferase / 2-methoxy-6-polyprenyl-1,4-benzoquinol methylase